MPNCANAPRCQTAPMHPLAAATAPAWTDQMTAFSALATAVLTLPIAIFALWAWLTSEEALKASRAAADAAREANEQAKRDSIERTRPYVFAQVLPGLAGPGCYDLVIQNLGQSAARRVMWTFSNPPSQPDDVATPILAMLRTPRTLPPGASLRTYWRMEEPTGFTDGTFEAGMPSAGELRVTYSSDDPTHPTYEDTFDFDIETAGFWPLGAAGPEPQGLERRDRLFYKLGRDIALHIAELRR